MSISFAEVQEMSRNFRGSWVLTIDGEDEALYEAVVEAIEGAGYEVFDSYGDEYEVSVRWE